MPTLYRDCALLDLPAGRLLPEQSILVDGDRISWIRPRDADRDPGPDVRVVDAGGTTAVPGMVDAHSHLTMPGGSHWIDRGFEPAESMLATAEDNARLLRQAGVRWARDVGAPARDGRAMSLTRAGSLPGDLSVEVTDGDQLLAAALGQLDDGADLVKLYLDGPDRETAPFTEHEVRRVVDAVHARGKTVTAHSGVLAGARAGVAGGVDCLEHAFELDADLAAAMAAAGTAMVSTLAVLESLQSFATTTLLPRFTTEEGRGRIAERRARAHDSVRLAHAAGVLIAAGTDFGGGSLRANQLAWEVQTLVAAGIPPVDALRAATVNGGRLLGEPDAGALREGGPADFVLVHGDPLSDPAALWRVWRTSW
jgi:imidazolonepropionase-like amidohydrolase